MIRRIKKWFYDRFLPATTKAMLYQELLANREEIDRLNGVIREKDAEIDGLQYGMRALRRININVEANK